MTNLCTHYRLPLFLELANRVELTVVLTSKGHEWYWLGGIPDDESCLHTVSAPSPITVLREVTGGNYDAVIVGLAGRATLLATFMGARLRGLPLVLWVGIWHHPRTLAHRLSRPIVRRLYRSAGAVVTYGPHISEFVRSESGRTQGIFESAQSVRNDVFRGPTPATAISAIRDRLNVGDVPAVIFVGRLEEDKGVDYLLDASATLDCPHVVLIAGDGPRRATLEARARSLGIDHRVRFLGHVSQQELPDILKASDMLVLPSISTERWREPWGLVVNEAMNCGLPVVSSDAVGAAAGGLVLHNRTGLVVPERDASALSTALRSLIDDSARRRRLGDAGRDHVLRWNYCAAADAFEDALTAARKARA